MQYFKGDPTEVKFYLSGAPILTQLSDDKSSFYDDAYIAAPLGDLISDLELAPLSNVIDKDIFRLTFSEIFNAFVSGGTFEAYLEVFQKVFGNDATITFTVPAPGKLQIAIHAIGFQLFDLIARKLTGSTYTYDEIVNQDGDNIASQQFKGIQSQYELEQMLFELVAGGVYTQVTLTLGA